MNYSKQPTDEMSPGAHNYGNGAEKLKITKSWNFSAVTTAYYVDRTFRLCL